MLNQIWSRLLNKLSPSKKNVDLTDYWRDRARRYGKRSVLNMAHRESEFYSVTEYQKQLLFPLLTAELNGLEETVLDFGCGPGRFTPGLAELVGGSAMGVDITPELIDIAPKSPSVSYRCISTGSLPVPDSSFDVVWSCLVLGGIPDDQIEKTIVELDRVLKPGGLFFYVENTAHVVSTDYWFFRDEDTYLKIAAFCNPRKLGSYEDMGQTITIFSGKKESKA
jgi:ubiquinone/menaquinone biosynthesis C-methylase UbiE